MHFAGQPAYILPPLLSYSDGPAGFKRDPGTALGDAPPRLLFLRRLAVGFLLSTALLFAVLLRAGWLDGRDLGLVEFTVCVLVVAGELALGLGGECFANRGDFVAIDDTVFIGPSAADAPGSTTNASTATNTADRGSFFMSIL